MALVYLVLLLFLSGLLQALLRWLRALGSSAVVMTATLPPSRRRALLEAWGVRAEARLVYLRAGRVHAFGEAELEEALAALPS